ncbi:MAG TPA: sulfur transferase domain-containing protein [Woeseiaceae bacterium]|nr:sulfur transferase domain-containing protein [Woeseiaceae bacterium]
MKTIQRAALLLALLWSAMLSANETELPSIPAVSSPVQGIVTAGRLDADNVRSVHEAGIRHVIDLTLDEETPDFDEAAAVRDAGMRYSNLPVQGASGLTLKNVQAFDTLLRESERPVLVHCSSSNRVGAMAALRAAWMEGKTMEEAIAIGKEWGLRGLEDEVRRRIDARF